VNVLDIKTFMFSVWRGKLLDQKTSIWALWQCKPRL